MDWLGNYVVVDPKLAAPRGTAFSAAPDVDCVDQLADDENQEEEGPVPSVDTAIPETNVGFKLLQKMGWKGAGLGREENGIVEPVKAGVEAGVRLGLGKQEQDEEFTNPENIHRKKLEVEIQANEDSERTKKRELQAEREQKIKEDVTQIKKTFYCEACSKQYNTAMEMDTHLSSYDHHHKKRLQESKAMMAERSRAERLKKEQKQREKEFARLNAQIARARGVVPGDTGTSQIQQPEQQAADRHPPVVQASQQQQSMPQPPPPPPPEPTYGQAGGLTMGSLGMTIKLAKPAAGKPAMLGKRTTQLAAPARPTKLLATQQFGDSDSDEGA